MYRIIAFLAVLLPLNALAVTINLDAEALKDPNGVRMTNGVIVLVADVEDFTGSNGKIVRNGFSGPTSTSFSGEDFLVYRWNFTTNSPEYGGPGVFQAAITTNYSGLWKAGDPLRLYWFPSNSTNDTTPGPNAPFGTFRSNTPETAAPQSSAWFTPTNSTTVTINGETATVPKESTISLAFFTSDANTLIPAGSVVTPADAGDAKPMVVKRYVFYNHSFWDGNDAGANASDDNAIAVDKVPLLPAGTANFVNYTSYTRGLNGIIIDISADISNPTLHQSITAGDFGFKLGNSNSPQAWASAPSPSSVSVRLGAGFNGSDRVTIIWADRAITKNWLQIDVKPTANTGLAADDVFYFGNAPGDTLNSATDAIVGSADLTKVRLNGNSSASITDPYDVDRNGTVGSSDLTAIRLNGQTTFSLITVP